MNELVNKSVHSSLAFGASDSNTPSENPLITDRPPPPQIFLVSFLCKNLVMGSWFFLFKFLERHAVWFEYLFELSNNSDVPSNNWRNREVYIFTLGSTRSICQTAKSEGWAYTSNVTFAGNSRKYFFRIKKSTTFLTSEKNVFVINQMFPCRKLANINTSKLTHKDNSFFT